MGQRVAHRRAVNVLDARHHKAHLTGLQGVFFDALGGENTQAVDLLDLADGFRHDFVPLAQGALLDADQRHNAQVVVEPGIDDQRLQGASRSPSGGGYCSMRYSSASSTPSPDLALTGQASPALIPMISSISVFTRSGSAWAGPSC